MQTKTNKHIDLLNHLHCQITLLVCFEIHVGGSEGLQGSNPA